MDQEKILYVDACPRTHSRTREFANALMQKLGGDVEHIILSEIDLPSINEAAVNQRTFDAITSHFSSDNYRLARHFARADKIVIAAPYWDLSFPALLKKYIEAVTVNGLTFSYSEEGIPVGLCKADTLYYVTTAGGPIFNEEFGYGYIKTMAQVMYGIKNTKMFSAENLDVFGNDPDAILQDAIAKIQL